MDPSLVFLAPTAHLEIPTTLSAFQGLVGDLLSITSGYLSRSLELRTVNNYGDYDNYAHHDDNHEEQHYNKCQHDGNSNG